MSPSAFTPDWAVPPGETIQECMDERGYNARLVAVALGMNMLQFKPLLAGDTRLTEALAKRLHILFGVSTEFWLALEADYRDALERQTETIVRRLFDAEFSDCETCDAPIVRLTHGVWQHEDEGDEQEDGHEALPGLEVVNSDGLLQPLDDETLARLRAQTASIPAESPRFEPLLTVRPGQPSRSHGPMKRVDVIGEVL